MRRAGLVGLFLADVGAAALVCSLAPMSVWLRPSRSGTGRWLSRSRKSTAKKSQRYCQLRWPGGCISWPMARRKCSKFPREDSRSRSPRASMESFQHGLKPGRKKAAAGSCTYIRDRRLTPTLTSAASWNSRAPSANPSSRQRSRSLGCEYPRGGEKPRKRRVNRGRNPPVYCWRSGFRSPPSC
jgi:hypothetical protein